ncbi:hypothetical protein JKP88DRAFT_177373, partial [Tribonema minus]
DSRLDLVLAGVEASLWIAEQFACDVKNLFPHINIATVSANKLLGIGPHSSDKVTSSAQPAGIHTVPRRRLLLPVLGSSASTFARSCLPQASSALICHPSERPLDSFQR